MPFPQYLLLAVGGMSSAAVAGLYFFQERLLYHPDIPTRAYERTPSAVSLPFTDVDLVASDGVRLHSWLILQDEASARSAPTLVYFHGNAGNISHRIDDVRRVHANGYNVLMVSYRGYGRSQGKPSEPGFVLDAMAAVEYVKDRGDVLDVEKVFLFGRSIGGAVALAAAEKMNDGFIKGVIVENTFTSIDDMIDVVMPALRFVKFLNRNKWNSLDRLRRVKAPMLFISGQRDELCPPAHMARLYQAAEHCPIRELYKVPMGSHNDTWAYGGQEYRDRINRFVEKCCDRR